MATSKSTHLNKYRLLLFHRICLQISFKKFVYVFWFQFYQWYSELEWELLQEEDAEYQAYLLQLEQHQTDCKQLLNQVLGIIDNLSKLDSQYGFVSNKTASLHEACEQMLIDQTKLTKLADDLEKQISYFVEYEKIQSQLSSPTLSVHGELFRDILDRLDKCIDYMHNHVIISL